ncbi:CdaR family transcriptional regulator [Acidaminobacter sp. JC074]|uniref:PucR family transcriptional regulator n=1 Tax=Acidaminobacter sp. JC074 TaxID=2530199 RepID=UPI001F104071|nr:helix-turn-helix domain-containing protein [Acidaminobacter sp. JC074]
MISLNEIIDNLSSYKIIKTFLPAETIYFDNVTIFHKEIVTFRNTTLYIAKASNLVDCKVSFDNNLIVIRDCDKNFSCLMTFSYDTDQIKLLNEISYSITKAIKNDAYLNRLFDDVIEKKGMQSLINRTAELLKNPVFLLNASYKVVNHSANETFEDASWDETLKKGYSTNEAIRLYRRNGVIEKLLKSENPIIVESLSGGQPMILSKISLENKMVAILAIVQSKERLDKNILSLVKRITAVLIIEIERDKSVLGFRKGTYKKILFDLIDGKMDSLELASRRLEMLKINKFPKFYAIKIIADKPVNTYYLKMYLNHLFSEGIILDREDELILLLPEAKKNLETFSKLEGLLKEHDLKAGISYEFDDILDIRFFYLQAVEALGLSKIMKSGGCMYFYEDYLVYSLLRHVSDVSLDQLCLPQLSRIEKYDYLHGTDYLNTLHCYLSSGKNITLTASLLYAHRNTINHRLKKIREITNMDLSDGENSFKLFFSLKVRNYLSKL